MSNTVLTVFYISTFEDGIPPFFLKFDDDEAIPGIQDETYNYLLPRK